MERHRFAGRFSVLLGILTSCASPTSSPEGTTTTFVENSGVLVYAPRAARAQKVIFDTPDDQLIHEADTPLRTFFDSRSPDFAPGKVDYAKTTILGDIVMMYRNREFIRDMLEEFLDEYADDIIAAGEPTQNALLQAEAVVAEREKEQTALLRVEAQSQLARPPSDPSPNVSARTIASRLADAREAASKAAERVRAEQQRNKTLLLNALFEALERENYPDMRDDAIRQLVCRFATDVGAVCERYAGTEVGNHTAIWNLTTRSSPKKLLETFTRDLVQRLTERRFFKNIIDAAVDKRLGLFRNAGSPAAQVAKARSALNSFLQQNLGDAFADEFAAGKLSLWRSFLEQQNSGAGRTLRALPSDKAMSDGELNAFGGQLRKALLSTLEKNKGDLAGAMRRTLLDGTLRLHLRSNDRSESGTNVERSRWIERVERKQAVIDAFADLKTAASRMQTAVDSRETAEKEVTNKEESLERAIADKRSLLSETRTRVDAIDTALGSLTTLRQGELEREARVVPPDAPSASAADLARSLNDQLRDLSTEYNADAAWADFETLRGRRAAAFQRGLSRRQTAARETREALDSIDTKPTVSSSLLIRTENRFANAATELPNEALQTEFEWPDAAQNGNTIGASLNAFADTFDGIPEPDENAPLRPTYDAAEALRNALRQRTAAVDNNIDAATQAITAALGHFGEESFRDDINAIHSASVTLDQEKARLTRRLADENQARARFDLAANGSPNEEATNRVAGILPTLEAAVREINQTLTEVQQVGVEPFLEHLRHRVRRVLDSIRTDAPTDANVDPLKDLPAFLTAAFAFEIPADISKAVEGLAGSFEAAFRNHTELLASDRPILAALLETHRMQFPSDNFRTTAVRVIPQKLAAEWRDERARAAATETQTDPSADAVGELLRRVLDSPDVSYLFGFGGVHQSTVDSFKAELYNAFKHRLETAIDAEREAGYEYWWLTFYPKAIPRDCHSLEGQSIIEIGFPKSAIPEAQYHRWLQDKILTEQPPFLKPRRGKRRTPSRAPSSCRHSAKIDLAASVLNDFMAALDSSEVASSYQRVRQAIVAALSEMTERVEGVRRESLCCADGDRYRSGLRTLYQASASVAPTNFGEVDRAIRSLMELTVAQDGAPSTTILGIRRENIEPPPAERGLPVPRFLWDEGARRAVYRQLRALELPPPKSTDTTAALTALVESISRRTLRAAGPRRVPLGPRPQQGSPRAPMQPPEEAQRRAVEWLSSELTRAYRKFRKQVRDTGTLATGFDAKSIQGLAETAVECEIVPRLLELERLLQAPLRSQNATLTSAGQTIRQDIALLLQERLLAELRHAHNELVAACESSTQHEDGILRFLRALESALHHDDAAPDARGAARSAGWAELRRVLADENVRAGFAVRRFSLAHVLFAVVGAAEAGITLPYKVDLYCHAVFSGSRRFSHDLSGAERAGILFEIGDSPERARMRGPALQSREEFDSEGVLGYLGLKGLSTSSLAALESRLVSMGLLHKRSLSLYAAATPSHRSRPRVKALQAGGTAEAFSLLEAFPRTPNLLDDLVGDSGWGRTVDARDRAALEGVLPSPTDRTFAKLLDNLSSGHDRRERERAKTALFGGLTLREDLRSRYVTYPELWRSERYLDAAREELRSTIVNQYYSSYPAIPDVAAVKEAFLADGRWLPALVYQMLRDLWIYLYETGLLFPPADEPKLATANPGPVKPGLRVRVNQVLEQHEYLTPDAQRTILKAVSSSEIAITDWVERILEHQPTADQLGTKLLDVLYAPLWEALDHFASTDRTPVPFKRIDRQDYADFLRWSKPVVQERIQIVDILPASRDDLVSIAVNEGGVIARAAGKADAAAAYDVNKLQMAARNADIVRRSLVGSELEGEESGTTPLESLAEAARRDEATANASEFSDLSRLVEASRSGGYSLGATAKGSLYARAKATLAYARRREYLDAAITAAGRGDNFAKWVIGKSEVRGDLGGTDSNKLVAAAHKWLSQR